MQIEKIYGTTFFIVLLPLVPDEYIVIDVKQFKPPENVKAVAGFNPPKF